jgi:hypothetical protein
MRDMNDFSGVRREGAWILGCVAGAVGFCHVAPDYGYNPVPFFSALFYGLTAAARWSLKFL